MSLSNDGTNTTMLVTPTGYNGGNGNGMWNGDWSSWIILFLIFGMFGGWGGYGGFGGGWGGMNGAGINGALTRGDLCMDMSFQDVKEGVAANGAAMQAGFRNVDNAICQLGYNNAQLANGIQMQIANEGRGIDNAVCQLGYNTQLGFNTLGSQLASCCCDIREGISGVNYNAAMNANTTQGAIRDGFCQTNYNAATNTRDIIEAQRGGFQSIMDKLCQMEYNGLNDKYQAAIAENQALKSDISNMRQNAYLVDQLGPKCPQAAYVVQPPQNVTFPVGCNGVVTYGNAGCACAA